MAKNKKTFLILSFLLLFGFFLRVILSPIIIKGDLLVYHEWSKVLYEEGLKGSYFRQGWIYSFPTQPPLMMLLFWVSRWLYEHRYFLALAHNIFRFPPASSIIWVAQNGEFFFLKLWAILGDILSALFIYWLVLRISRKQKLAILGMVAFLFNPISIFISAIWGQTDILAAFWALFAFFIFYWRWGKLLSPLFFMIGILIKPTVLVLLPFYFVFLIRELFNSPVKERRFFWGATIVGGLLSLLVILLLFIPFWNQWQSFLPYLQSIVLRRIIPLAKGVNKASNSAFNIYSAIFIIDRTLGSDRVVFLTLDQIGMGIFFLINFFAAYLWWQKNPRTLIPRVFWLTFLVYFVAEGTFLFKTGMLERYFLPAFLPAVILFFMVEKQLKIVLFSQNLIWFANLFCSFFYRESGMIKLILTERDYLGVRLLSFLNVFIYIFIVYNLIVNRDKKA